MFNMKTSDLFKRAKQLADLEGSDFITWNEAINCINESNVELYQKMLNMGDNSFVKDFHITDKEMELPSDFWQLKGVYLWNNGNRQIINRRADSDGIHHLSYELRNGKIYLFGNPNDVYVEYFPKPEKLFFKPNEVKLSLDPDKTYMFCFGHTFLYKDTDESQNKTLSLFDFDGLKTKRHFIQYDWSMMSVCVMGDDWVYISGAGGNKFYNISSDTVITVNAGKVIITESGNVYYTNIDSQMITTPDGNSIKSMPLFLTSAKDVIYSDDALEDFYYVDSFNRIKHDNDIINNFSVGNNSKGFYGNGGLYVTAASGLYFCKGDEVTKLDTVQGSVIGFIGINENTGYGYVTKKYGTYFVCPYVEDTPLEYPNSTYFQIIAYILAIMFKSKQGADISLLSSQLQMAEQTFEDTLGSDAFQFTRMGNVYN